MRLRAPLALAMLAAVVLAPAPPAVATAASTYTNPVSAGTVDTFPDPAVIRGKDGLWYAYGTTNPIRQSAGETGEHILPILTSTDLVSWTYRGDVYPLDRKPGWWPAGTRPWAPDIRQIDGRYHLTYSLSLSVGGVALLPAPRRSDRGPTTA